MTEEDKLEQYESTVKVLIRDLVCTSEEISKLEWAVHKKENFAEDGFEMLRQQVLDVADALQVLKRVFASEQEELDVARCERERMERLAKETE